LTLFRGDMIKRILPMVFSIGVILLSASLQAQEPPAQVLKQSFGAGEGYQDGELASARFFRPQGMCGIGGSVFYIADTFNHCLRKLNVQNNEVKTVLGRCTEKGREEASNVAREAIRLDTPADIACLPKMEYVYLLDSGNNRIIKLNSATAEELVLHFNQGEVGGERLSRPLGLALDPKGDALYVADTGNHRVLRVDLKTAAVERMAGTGFPGFELKGKTAQDLSLNEPTDVFPLHNSSGFALLFVADSRNGVIRKIEPGDRSPWIMSLFAGGDHIGLLQEPPGPAQLIRLDRPYRLGFFDGPTMQILYVGLPTQAQVTAFSLTRHSSVVIEGERLDKAPLRPQALYVDSYGDLWLFDQTSTLRHYWVKPENTATPASN